MERLEELEKAVKAVSSRVGQLTAKLALLDADLRRKCVHGDTMGDLSSMA